MRCPDLKLGLATLHALIACLASPAVAGERFDYRYADLGYYDSGLDGTLVAMDGDDLLELSVDDGDGFDFSVSFALNRKVHLFGGYMRAKLDLDLTQTVWYPELPDMRLSYFATSADASWNARNDLTADGVINHADLEVLKRTLGTVRRVTTVSSDGDLSRLRLGIGMHRTLAPNWGAYARLFVDFSELDHGVVQLFDTERDLGASQTGLGATLGLRIKATDLLELEGALTYAPAGDVDLLGRNGDDRLKSRLSVAAGGRLTLTRHVSLLAGVSDNGEATSWSLGARIFFGDGSIFWPVPRARIEQLMRGP